MMDENHPPAWDEESRNGNATTFPAESPVDAVHPIASPAPIADAPPAPTRDSEGGNVEKIRDILFGSQMRDYDRRFTGVEDRLLQEATQLRDEVGRRLGATEHFLRGELEELSTRLTAEQRERTQGMREAMDALTMVNRELSERIGALAEQTAQQHRELRHALNEQHRLLGEEMAHRHQEMTAALRREAAELRLAKTDRTALAAMFADVAQRLSSDGDAR